MLTNRLNPNLEILVSTGSLSGPQRSKPRAIKWEATAVSVVVTHFLGLGAVP